jgi:hypothetical protein
MCSAAPSFFEDFADFRVASRDLRGVNWTRTRPGTAISGTRVLPIQGRAVRSRFRGRAPHHGPQSPRRTLGSPADRGGRRYGPGAWRALWLFRGGCACPPARHGRLSGWGHSAPPAQAPRSNSTSSNITASSLTAITCPIISGPGTRRPRAIPDRSSRFRAKVWCASFTITAENHAAHYRLLFRSTPGVADRDAKGACL